MALLFFDSFAHYNTSTLQQKYTSGAAFSSITASGGRRNAPYCTAINLLRGLNPFDPTTSIVGKAVRFSLLGQAFVEIGKGNAEQCHLQTNSDGSISAYRLAVSLGSSAAGVLSVGTWYYLEVKALLSTTVGTIEVRVNGVSVITLTGLNNCGEGSEAWTYVKITGGDFQDYYICDGAEQNAAMPNNDFLGDCTAEALLPEVDASRCRRIRTGAVAPARTTAPWWMMRHPTAIRRTSTPAVSSKRRSSIRP